ncbi:YcxB family protein, partial [Chloroflexota bacterium]
MEIESELTRANYMKLLSIIVFRQWNFYLLVVVMMLLAFLSVITEKSILLAWVVVIFAFLYYIIKILYMGLSSKNRNFFLRLKYVFNAEDITINSPISNEVVKWEAFIRWRKIAGHYLLYLSTATFLSINKSSIPVAQVDDFEAMLRSKI